MLHLKTHCLSSHAIVPFKTMNELSKILSAVKSDSINISLSERQISFQVGTSLIVSRLINGGFLIISK